MKNLQKEMPIPSLQTLSWENFIRTKLKDDETEAFAKIHEQHIDTKDGVFEFMVHIVLAPKNLNFDLDKGPKLYKYPEILING